MLIACLLFAVGQLGFNAVTLDTWMDEGKYLMKGYWYLPVRSLPIPRSIRHYTCRCRFTASLRWNGCSVLDIFPVGCL
jgi:hypothetical protein